MEPVLRLGAAGVPIASMARHIDPNLAETDALFDQPLDAAALDALKPLLFGADKRGEKAQAIASQLAYILSKRTVTRLSEQGASA